MKNKLSLLILPLMTITACSKPDTVMSKPFYFGTQFIITMNKKDEGCISEIEQILLTYDKHTDNYLARDVNNVYTINNNLNTKIDVDEKLYTLLKKSIEVKDEGAIYFNPLCGSLSEKWREAIKNKKVLTNEVINEELNKINTSELSFSDSEYKVGINGEAKLDLGAIAKGYALDKVYEHLKEKEVTQYLINGGRSSLLIGEKNTKDGLYQIGLRDVPNAYLKLKNCFVSTSGVSEQFAIINNKKYSHIVNPITGSAISNYDAVIVINKCGYYGDVMSTSLMMSSLDEIKELEKEHDFKTVVIKDNKIIYKENSVEVYYH